MRAALFCLTILLVTSAPLRGTASKESTGLDVLVLPTIQYAHQDIWTKTPNGRGPANTGVGQVVRGQEVHILVLATNYGIGTDGNAEVSYNVSFTRPDGKTGNSKQGLVLIPRGPGHDSRHVRKAIQMVGFIANQEDPLGEWRAVVDATDQVSAVTVRVEQPFTVVGNEVLQAPLPPGTEQGSWLMRYHRKPVPQQLLAAFRFMAENPPAGTKPHRGVENGAWLGFFEQVLSDNPWLLPHVIARLEQATGRERELLATCLAYARRDDLSFFQTLAGKAREAFMRQRVQTWPVPTKEPLNGVQLDVLWGRFFASARYEPIRELVAVLAYHPFREALNDYKKLKKKPAEPPVEAYKCAVFGAALMSLRSNMEQDKVVRDYCEGILLRKELPEADHLWLAATYQAALENLKQAAPAGPPAKNPG